MKRLATLVFVCLMSFNTASAQSIQAIQEELKNNQTLLEQLNLELQKQIVLNHYTEAQVLKSLAQACLNNIHTLKLELAATQKQTTSIPQPQHYTLRKPKSPPKQQKTNNQWPMPGKVSIHPEQPHARIITHQSPQTVRTPSDGQIIFSQTTELLGHLIIIRHENHYMSLYGHIHTPLVETHQKVKAGDAIASSTHELIFEVRRKGLKTSPERWLQKSSKLH